MAVVVSDKEMNRLVIYHRHMQSKLYRRVNVQVKGTLYLIVKFFSELLTSEAIEGGEILLLGIKN